jgi:uncharacterized protein YdhG (YjbR/CyaY superfamily)
VSEDTARVDAYLEGLPLDQQEALRSLREQIARLAPDAEEGISYGMPAFRYRGRPLIGYSASKAHLSLHPMSSDVVAAHLDRLGDWPTSKGTIRFTPGNPLPDDLVSSLLRARMAEIEGG